MSLVYKAFDIIERKNVAIKILKDEFIGNAEFVRRFKNESKAVAMLSHPNIVKVFDVSFGTKLQYIVMEYIFGVTLKEYFSKYTENNFDDEEEENFNGSVPWHEALFITKQILHALSHAHSKGIIHRDIKPQNIMIPENGKVKVTDFGIARFFKNETQTMTDRTIGSVHYISPEQAKGAKTNCRSDIYSVGVMLYEMLTGKLPFEADNAVSVAIMQMQTDPEKLRKIIPTIPESLEKITLKAMQKRPEYRFSSAEEMLADIKKFEQDNNVKFSYNFFVDNNPTKVLDISDLNPESSKESQKKKRAIFITSGIASAVIIFALVFMFMTMFTSYGGSSRDIEVPNFIGMKVSDIQDKYKFSWNIEPVYDSTKPEGVILDQEPTHGSKKVKSNSVINLKVNSSGMLAMVPNLTGVSEETAKTRLSNVGLKCEVLAIPNEIVPEGKVINSDPPEGSKTTVESTVRIYISTGKEVPTAKIPNVIDISLTEAKQEITSKGFRISPEILYENSGKPKDTVLSTTPLPGIETPLGTIVKFIVSSGIKKDKIIEIPVDLPPVSADIILKIYVDGTLDNSKTVTVDPTSINKKIFYFKGNEGEKEITVKINGFSKAYRVYKINFNEPSPENCKLIVSNPYSNLGNIF
jgi:serine/threonine-protein kinase